MDTEADDIVNQLMDAAGIDMTAAMGSVPASRGGVKQGQGMQQRQQPGAQQTDAEMEAEVWG